MTLAKAKLYKTARIAQDNYGSDIEAYGLNPGDVVSVQFTGKGGFGGFNFLVNNTVCLNEIYLTDFVL
jgi:protein involved in polysaccharide export with SLBB domain